MKITIYDLLGLVKDGKAPEKIKYEYSIYELTPERNDYYCKNEMRWFTNEINCLEVLNDYVEIIEESKKIEKLDVALLGQCDNWLRCPTNKVTKQDVELNPYIIDNIKENTLYFQRKINELIDEINNLKDND